MSVLRTVSTLSTLSVKAHSTLLIQALEYHMRCTFPFLHNAGKSMLLLLSLCLSGTQSIRGCCGFDRAPWCVVLMLTAQAGVSAVTSEVSVYYKCSSCSVHTSTVNLKPPYWDPQPAGEQTTSDYNSNANQLNCWWAPAWRTVCCFS